MAIKDVSEKTVQQLISLQGKVAVITGGARGIGLGVARRFAEVGATVVIADLRQSDADEAADSISKAFGGRAFGVTVDVTDEASVVALADTAVRELGRLDIWVNNAGIFPGAVTTDLLTADWDTVQGVNLRGTFIGCREAARRMIAQEPKGGVIINVASVRGIRGGPNLAAYTASKHGVVGLTKALGIELGQHDIRVLGLAPTGVDTPGAAARTANATGAELERVTAKRKSIAASLPLGRTGTADDIARVALFCASDMSILMTGSTLLVDAGGLA
ncbi:MAG: short-chain dehydrogenase [Rhodospirillales bacterium]|nr:short-chain dehydrogenase [Rhodospirillales bacterium]